MISTPLWVTVDEVVDLNRHVIAKSPIIGEPFGLTDPAALGSAVARPIQHFNYGPEDTQDDLVLLGAKLCIGISEAQAFRQGNKRTGFAAMEMFFNLNSYEISHAAVGQVAELIMRSAHPDHAQRIDDEEFAEGLDPYVVDFNDTITMGGLVSAGKMSQIALALSGVTVQGVTIAEILNPPKWTSLGLNREDDA